MSESPISQSDASTKVDSPPGDVTQLVNIVKGKIEETHIDEEVQKELAIILSLLAKIKAQGALDSNRRYLELALKSLASEHPNMSFVRGLRNELELNSAQFSMGLPKLIAIIAGPTPISAMISGLLATLIISPLIYIALIGIPSVNMFLTDHFDMSTLNILLAASFVGGVVSLLSRLEQFASLRLYNPNLVLLNSFCKPLIGVALSMFVYAMFMSEILPIAVPDVLKHGTSVGSEPRTESYYLLIWAIGFLSGFSERLAHDIIRSAEDLISPKKGKK